MIVVPTFELIFLDIIFDFVVTTLYLLLKHIFSFLYATKSAITKTRNIIRMASVSPTTAAIGMGSEIKEDLAIISQKSRRLKTILKYPTHTIYQGMQ